MAVTFRPAAGQTLAVFACCVAVGLGGSPPSLDPATYVEPDEREYWGGAADASMPFTERRFDEMSHPDFDELVADGKIFVVHNISGAWAMKDWDCAFFRKDAEMSKAQMQQQYAATDGPGFVGFQSDWENAKTSSGAQDSVAPQVAPFYWGIKDVQYSDASKSPTWRKSMLKRVQKSFVLPHFMAKSNQRNFETTPEFWFSAAGAGAKAHMDTHVQATISVQLAGKKRWRLRPLGSRQAPYLAMIYKDGDVYKRRDRWEPHFNITLEQGDALFFPPGVIHETLTLSEECSSSVTFQFDQPMAIRYYRRFFPRVRRTADIHESWTLIENWATLKEAKRNKKLRGGLPYEEAKAMAPKVFSAFDKDGDGSLSLKELSKFGEDAGSVLGWHDLDQDGAVSAAEFAEGFAFWAATTFEVIKETPKEWRKYQLKDMQGSFNIEDLPPKTTKKMEKWGEKVESEASGRKEL